MRDYYEKCVWYQLIAPCRNIQTRRTHKMAAFAFKILVWCSSRKYSGIQVNKLNHKIKICLELFWGKMLMVLKQEQLILIQTKNERGFLKTLHRRECFKIFKFVPLSPSILFQTSHTGMLTFSPHSDEYNASNRMWFWHREKIFSSLKDHDAVSCDKIT